MPGWRHKLRKIQAAGWANASRAMASRLVRKAAASRMGRAITVPRATVDEADMRRALRPGYEGDRLARRLLDERPARHFLDEADAVIALLRRDFPAHIEAIVAEADAICAHRFSFLGKSVEFGPKIDWHWRPETGGSWPKAASAEYGTGGRFSYYRDDRPGDVKYPWELSRHQYWTTLGIAWRATGDDRYSREWVGQLLDWLEQNPYRHGMNWVSTMEVAIRIVSWANAYWLMGGSDDFRAHGLTPFLTGMLQHARHVSRYLTTDWMVPTNHLIGEAAGLYAFGALFPCFRDATGWRHNALRIFVRELNRQLFHDGVNKEQATGYHRFVADFAVLVATLERLNGGASPPVLDQRLEAMLDYEAAITPPGGRVPEVGDCDGGRGLFLDATVDFYDYRSWLALGAVRYGRADLARTARGGTPESVWALGAAGWDRFRAITPAQAPRGSRLFPEGGHAILRTGDGPNDHYVHLRCGAFGLGGEGSSGHSHADLLGLTIHWHGRPLAVDGGTFQYLCATEDRDFFRATARHSTVAPRGIDQGERRPLKEWGRVPEGRVLEWAPGPDGRGGRVAARMAAPTGFAHARTLSLSGDGLVITDTCELSNGLAGVPIEWRLLLAPGLDARTENDGFVVLRGGEPLVRLAHTGYDTAFVTDDWHSPAYGLRVPVRCLVLETGGARLSGRVTIADPE